MPPTPPTLPLLLSLALTLTPTAFSQATIPDGYRAVYITSMVNTQYVMTASGAAPIQPGAGLVVNTLSETPEQQWWLQDGATRIQLAETGLCVDAGGEANWKDMGELTLAECSDSADAQKFDVMEDGRIALEMSSPQQCVDLQYMRATPNNPVGLYSCAGLGNTGAADKGINWPLQNVTVV